MLKECIFLYPKDYGKRRMVFLNRLDLIVLKNVRLNIEILRKRSFSSVEFDVLWEKVLLKLPNLVNQFTPISDELLNGIVMSIRPNYCEEIFNGNKHIEIRKKFNSKWENHTVAIYSSSPKRELVGYATIRNVIEEKPEHLSNSYWDQLGCSKIEV